MKLNTIDLNKLYVFSNVAEAGSLRRAAVWLGRTPSAVSQSLSGLESSLGISLFRRIGVKMYLTEQGKQLFHGLEKNQFELQELLSGITQSQKQIEGTARLGLYTGCPSSYVGPTFGQVLKEHEAIQLKLIYGTHRELTTALVRNQIDLALSLTPLKERNRNLLSKKLFEEELVVVSAKTLPFPSGGQGFEHLPVIEYYESAPLFSQWLQFQFGSKSKIQLKVRAFASTLNQVVDLVERGVGFSLVPLNALTSTQKKTLTVHSKRQWKPYYGSVWLNYAKSGYISPAANFIKETFSNHGFQRL